VHPWLRSPSPLSFRKRTKHDTAKSAEILRPKQSFTEEEQRVSLGQQCEEEGEPRAAKRIKKVPGFAANDRKQDGWRSGQGIVTDYSYSIDMGVREDH
jgi:hypothetical protein